MRLVRKKVGDRKYNLVHSRTGTVIASAAMTGETGRDNYPWDWQLEGGRIFGKLDLRVTGSLPTLREIIDHIESNATVYGFLLPKEPVDGYSAKAGQYFRYAGYYYQATADAHGEFNAYIPVLNYKGNPSEIVVSHGDYIRIYEPEVYRK